MYVSINLLVNTTYLFIVDNTVKLYFIVSNIFYTNGMLGSSSIPIIC